LDEIACTESISPQMKERSLMSWTALGQRGPGTRLASMRGVEIIACLQQHPLRRYGGNAANAAGLVTGLCPL
jgi:hypothetical protein